MRCIAQGGQHPRDRVAAYWTTNRRPECSPGLYRGDIGAHARLFLAYPINIGMANRVCAKHGVCKYGSGCGLSHDTRGQATSSVIPDFCPGTFPSECSAPSDATRGCFKSAPVAGNAFSEFGHEGMVDDGVSPGVSCSNAHDLMGWYLDPVPSTLAASPQRPSEVDSSRLFDINTMDSSWHEPLTPRTLAKLPHVPEFPFPDNGG